MKRNNNRYSPTNVIIPEVNRRDQDILEDPGTSFRKVLSGLIMSLNVIRWITQTETNQPLQVITC